MTPTLLGRWQTRILLMATAGALATVFWGVQFDRMRTLFLLLLYVTLLGLVLDVIYQQLQLLRWDNDWPPIFHVATGILEGGLIWFFLKNPIFWDDTLPGIRMTEMLTFRQFLTHYASAFVLVYLTNWNLMKVIFPKWRWYGGQWLF